MKTVAERYRLAAYHNEQSWRAFLWFPGGGVPTLIILKCKIAGF